MSRGGVIPTQIVPPHGREGEILGAQGLGLQLLHTSLPRRARAVGLLGPPCHRRRRGRQETVEAAPAKLSARSTDV